MTRRWMFLFAMVLAASPPGEAACGVVRGVVRLPASGRAPAYASNPYPGRASSLAIQQGTVRGLVTDAVVSVVNLNPAIDTAIARDPSGKVLAQKDQAFSARVLSCVVGTTVDFPNQDPIYHNVFSVSPVKRFDLGKYPRGHSKKVTFKKPGLVPVFCDIHSNMACFILVLPNKAFTRPDATGAYALPALPAGSYVIKAWHPDFGETTRTVKVPATGEVSLELGL